ncbi:MAG TPA: serpin family protein [Kofleriaceae bacterium]|jgi:serpin B
MKWLWLLAAGCTSAPKQDVVAARALPAAIAGDAAMVVTGNNQFAVDIYNQQPAGNSFYSPFSISTAFAMLDAGAAGQTDTELRTAFHFTLPGDSLHTAYGALITSLDTGRSYNNYTLATADRLFGQQGFNFLQSYLDITKTDYEAPLQPVDFSDPDTARSTINAWVASQTDNKIPELFPEGSINMDTVLALANAILFKGTWAQQFDPTQTASGSFHIAGGADVQTPLMNAQMTIPLATIPNGRIGLLPFQGNDLAMAILLPDDADGLPTIEAEMTGANIASWVASATPTDTAVPVKLPKLQLTEGFDLVAMLQALGVEQAFEPKVANFSGIDGGADLFVQDAIHKATITVDEEGAEAAAATGISVGGDAGSSGTPPSLICDHSFVLMIYDQVTGSVLFMGRISDPTQGT